MTLPLCRQLERWERWSKEADRSSEGWPSDYPEWSALMAAAERLMLAKILSEGELQALERCWELSEEGEELSDFARTRNRECWAALQLLADSRRPAVRWQVYAAIPTVNPASLDLLLRGTSDPDPYCRRRAILALAELRPTNLDLSPIVSSAISDRDPYLRKAALELVRSSGDESLLDQVQKRLLRDSEEFVRREAQRGYDRHPA